MRKIDLFFALILALGFALGNFTPTAAVGPKVNVKGQVISISKEGVIQIETKKGETVLVSLPEGEEFPKLEVGDYVHVKGTLLLTGKVVADWVRVISSKELDEEDEDEGEEAEEEDDDEDEAKSESAFCDPDKDKGPHPLAVGIAKRYDKSAEEIMAYFCEGFGFGQIMLALQTDEDNAASMLEERKEGKGWGQIWKEMGLIGQPGQASSPPGHLKRPDHAGPPTDKKGKP